jgi:hypothetical protein
MTTEQKARAYDEALDRASKLRAQNPFDTVSQMMEYVFPELQESEDERIRKAIIDYFNLQEDNTTYSFISKKDIINWLEKQALKSECGKEDEHRVEDIIYFLDTAKKHYASIVELDACINWLKSIKERLGG